MVRAPDSWLKDRGFEFLQARRENFFCRVSSLCWILFRYPFHTRVTAVTHKRFRSFSLKGACGSYRTYTPYICGFEWSDMVDWCIVVWCTENLRRDGSCFTWHQLCNNQMHCQYTTSLDTPIKIKIKSDIKGFRSCMKKQSSGAVWKSKWPSWAFRPNDPYGFCGRKATLNHA